ncbi:MAG: Fic family protein [Alphaproteobacteria bacterium]|nr:Fic family protein [Alphaproteobacteria bacterium]
MGESYWNQTGDPYQYAGSSVLKNIPNLKDADALDVFEHRATALRLDEAVESAAGKPVSLALWQYIHRTLFQDVYGWAGEIRSVQLAKGSTVFAMPEHIETEAARIFKELATDNLSDPGRLAFYFGELNVLHPFREGNGRTQKLLFDEVVRALPCSICPIAPPWLEAHHT